MRVYKATGSRYRINILGGGKGVYIFNGVTEKPQESEINSINCVGAATTSGRHYSMIL